MIPLHKVSRGLLELLRARTLGQNPSELSNAVVATVNATPMYGADLQVVDNNPAGAAAINSTTTRTQVFGGRLLVLSGVLTMGAAAGTYLRMRLWYSPGANYTTVSLGNEVVYTAPALVAGSTYTVSFAPPEPIVFSPGAQMILSVFGDAGGADHQPTLRTLFENYSP